MMKKPEAKATKGATKAAHAAKTAIQTVTVAEADKTPHDELMKLPKAQIVREKMSIPENKTRFMVDVNNKTKKGKTIIALMESLRDGDAAAIEKVTEALEALATVVAKKPTTEK
jgi:dihydroorotate dehydrogenase